MADRAFSPYPDSESDATGELQQHDRSIQTIYGVALQLEDCMETLHSEPEETAATLDLALWRLNVLILDLRQRIYELHNGEQPTADTDVLQLARAVASAEAPRFPERTQKLAVAGV